MEEDIKREAEKMPSCSYCGAEMILAWSGQTPFNFPLEAYICPKCHSTLYLGEPKDPCFKLIYRINRAFRKVVAGG